MDNRHIYFSRRSHRPSLLPALGLRETFVHIAYPDRLIGGRYMFPIDETWCCLLNNCAYCPSDVNHLYPYLAFVCSNELTHWWSFRPAAFFSFEIRWPGLCRPSRSFLLLPSLPALQNKARSSPFDRLPFITFFPLYIYSARTGGSVRKLVYASANLIGPTAVPPPSRRRNLAHRLRCRLGWGPLRLAVNKSAGLLYSRT